MAAPCLNFSSSKAFTTDCAPYCSADCSALLILLLVNGFHNSLRAILLCGWQRIAHSSARQQVSQPFARCIALRMARRMALLFGSGFTHFFHLSMTFLTFYVPQIARRIAHSFARLQLSPGFTCQIAPRIARRIAHYFRTSRVHPPYCSSDETSSRSWVHSFHPLVNEFANDPRHCGGLA